MSELERPTKPSRRFAGFDSTRSRWFVVANTVLNLWAVLAETETVRRPKRGGAARTFEIGEVSGTTERSWSETGNGGYDATCKPTQNTTMSEPMGHREFEKRKQ